MIRLYTAGVSLGSMGDLLRTPPESPRIITALCRIEEYKGGLIGPPLCRETGVSRTADFFLLQSGDLTESVESFLKQAI